MAKVYPEEARPSAFGIDAVNARGYEYPLVDAEGDSVAQTISNAVATTPWILTPRGVQNICLVIEVTGTVTCHVQVTANRVDEVIDGTAFGLTLGNISASTRYELKPFTAVRLSQTAGTGSCTIHYRAQ